MVHYAPTKDDTALMETFESLDYEEIESKILRKEKESLSAHDLRAEDKWRWIFTFFIGMFTGMVAFFVHFAVKGMQEWKFGYIYDFISHSQTYSAFFTYTGFNVLLGLVGSASLVYFVPAACGSGIPDVKAYLNGVRVHKAFNVKTFFGKVGGVILAVASSLPCGPEGPMIHIGGLIGGGVGQGSSKTLKFEIPMFKRFRNPRDRRDFISTGTAAGVSAAFGAPIGGILFSIEECSSFWSHSLTWRTFFGCMVATFTVNFFLSGYDGSFDQKAVILFNVGQSNGYRFPELLPFLLIACLGGGFGSAFVFINFLINQFRRKYIAPFRYRRVLEMFIMLVVCSTVFFVSTSFLGVCKKNDDDTGQSDYAEAAYGSRQNVQWDCPDGHYNDAASLFMVSQERIVKHLFSRGTADQYGNGPLIVLAITYATLAAWCTGSAVSGGIVIPKLVIGAAYGRLFGQVVYSLFPDSDIDPGTYALVGASAFFGGVSRMTLSLTIILLEITNDLQFLVPIMLSVIVAKFVGDFLTPPLYDLLIFLKCIPFLEAEPSSFMEKLNCRSIMAKDLVTLSPVMEVQAVLEKLESNNHGGFPVVDSKGRMVGIILRNHVLTIIDQHWYVSSAVKALSKGDFFSESTTKEKLRVKDIRFRHPGRLQDTIDLRPFMHTAPITVSPRFSVSRAFQLFRTMGMRHLSVVDDENRVVGMITRKDLMEHRVEEIYEKTKTRGRAGLHSLLPSEF
eukprot:ANDGO_08420.mRNA.1 Chloride channel protein C